MAHKWTLGTTLVCLGLAGAAAVQAQEARPECAVAAVLIDRWAASTVGLPKVLISDVREREPLSAEGIATPPTGNHGLFGWRETAPSRAAADAYVGAVEALPAVESCTGLRALAESRGILVWPREEAQEHLSWDENGLASHEWLLLETPVVSPLGDEALAQESQACGLECGSTALLFLRRRANGQWEVVDRGLVSIS